MTALDGNLMKYSARGKRATPVIWAFESRVRDNLCDIKQKQHERQFLGHHFLPISCLPLPSDLPLLGTGGEEGREDQAVSYRCVRGVRSRHSSFVCLYVHMWARVIWNVCERERRTRRSLFSELIANKCNLWFKNTSLNFCLSVISFSTNPGEAHG